MTVRVKALLILGALASLNMAIWGAKQLITGLYDPILKALGV